MLKKILSIIILGTCVTTSVKAEEITSLQTSQYLKLPKQAIDYFLETNVDVITMQKEIDFINPTIGNNLNGLYDKKRNIVFVEENSTRGEKTLFHELGHAYFNDNGENRIINKLPYKFAYYKERGSMDNKHYSNSIDEYYAEVFSVYCTNKEKLKENFPLTYKLMEKLFVEK